jgi:peptidoglycan/xylan/chitin deacetylase (PgdA/CDA1 family)
VQVKAGMAKVPILLYHNIQEKGSSPYIVRPAEFRAQMQALHEAGYQTVTISRLADVLRGGGSLPEKTVVITFDDGYESVYLNAYPILEEFGFQGVVFVIANTLEKDKSYGYLKQSQLRELLRRDWEIGSHSISHHNLKTTPLGLRNEIEGSKQILEEAIGAPVTTFAYPYNISNAWIRERVEEYGYEAAVGVDIFVRQTADRLYFLSRREVQRDTRLTAFLALLEPGAYEAAMLPPPPTATQTTEPALPR